MHFSTLVPLLLLLLPFLSPLSSFPPKLDSILTPSHQICFIVFKKCSKPGSVKTQWTRPLGQIEKQVVVRQRRVWQRRRWREGQVLPGPQPEQRGGGLLHPRRGPGPGHAGGPHRILLQVTQRGQKNEANIYRSYEEQGPSVHHRQRWGERTSADAWLSQGGPRRASHPPELRPRPGLLWAPVKTKNLSSALFQ